MSQSLRPAEVAWDVRVRQLKTRRNNGFAFDDDPAKADAERTARLALDDEDAGKLADAESRWTKLLKFKDNKDEFMRIWSLVALKYLEDLAQIERLHKEVKARIENEQGKPAIGNTETEKLALDALRFELEEKWDDAKGKWDDLKALTRQRDDLRRWHLLAAKCRRDLDHLPRKKAESAD